MIWIKVHADRVYYLYTGTVQYVVSGSGGILLSATQQRTGEDKSNRPKVVSKVLSIMIVAVNKCIYEWAGWLGAVVGYFDLILIRNDNYLHANISIHCSQLW